MDHVVALRLTVDQNVQVKVLLELDNLADLLLDEFLVLLSGNLALGELVALNADLLGLGEGTNCGSGEQGQLDGLGLLSNAGSEGRLAEVVSLSNSGLAGLDRGVVSALGSSARLDGLGVGLKLSGNGSRALSNSLADNNHFLELLDSEAEPVTDLRVKLLLALEGVGNMQKRRGSGNDDTVLSKLLNSSLDLLNSSLEVGLPDITSIDLNREKTC